MGTVPLTVFANETSAAHTHVEAKAMQSSYLVGLGRRKGEQQGFSAG